MYEIEYVVSESFTIVISTVEVTAVLPPPLDGGVGEEPYQTFVEISALL